MAEVQQDWGRPVPPAYFAAMKERVHLAFTSELQAIAGAAEVLAALRLPKVVASSSAPAKLEQGLRFVELFDFFAPDIVSAQLGSAAWCLKTVSRGCVRRGRPACGCSALQAAATVRRDMRTACWLPARSGCLGICASCPRLCPRPLRRPPQCSKAAAGLCYIWSCRQHQSRSAAPPGAACFSLLSGRVAQLAEHSTLNRQVAGSIPAASTMIWHSKRVVSRFSPSGSEMERFAGGYEQTPPATKPPTSTHLLVSQQISYRQKRRQRACRLHHCFE